MTCKIFDLHREWYKDGGKSGVVTFSRKTGTNSGGRSFIILTRNSAWRIFKVALKNSMELSKSLHQPDLKNMNKIILDR